SETFISIVVAVTRVGAGSVAADTAESLGDAGRRPSGYKQYTSGPAGDTRSRWSSIGAECDGVAPVRVSYSGRCCGTRRRSYRPITKPCIGGNALPGWTSTAWFPARDPERPNSTFAARSCSRRTAAPGLG